MLKTTWLVMMVMVVMVVLVVTDGQRTRVRNRSGSNTDVNVNIGRRNRQRSQGNRGRNSGGGRRTGGRRRGGVGGAGRRTHHPSCEEIYLPMCKGLVPYTHTKLPNKYNHTTQAEVYRVLEHMWAHMDHSCSVNTRMLLCSLYLPKCRGRRSGMGPCKRTCMAAKRKCSRPLQQMLRFNWDKKLSCKGLKNRGCLRPKPERQCQHEYPACVSNSALPVCSNLTFTWGTIPNMFQQCNVQEINTEVRYYDALRASGCHAHLNFLLCGVYSPFCIRSEVPFTFPCRELCEEVRASCEGEYRRLYHGLAWPNKLQCHRYPSTNTEGYTCVMPNEGNNYQAGGAATRR